MALNNTMDRYKYIYGSAVQKLDVEEVPVRRRRTNARPKKSPEAPTQRRQTRVKKAKVDSERQRAIQHNQKKFLAFDCRYMLTLLMAVVFVAAACFVLVNKSSQISDLSREVKQLKTEKAELINKQAALKSEIDKSLDLEEIQTYAIENLNMTYPSGSNVIYYTSDSTDYFRQYGNVDTGE